MSERPVLPATWMSLCLGDVINYGETEKAEPDEISASTWVLELEDIERDSSRVLSRLTFADRRSKSSKNRFNSGDVLYGKLRPYLNKVVYADASGVCTTEIVPLKPNFAVHGRFLFHWLRHPAFLSYVTEVSHGVNMPRLGTEAGRRAPFILAPRQEQQRIADKLDALLGRVDASRDRLVHVCRLLKRFRQSVFAAATSGRLTKDWRGRGSSTLWGDADIQSIARVGTGSTPARSNASFYASAGTPWVTSSATSQALVTAAVEFVTPAAIAAHRLKVYPPGTLLVALYGEGKTRGQVTELGIHAAINQACAAVVVDESRALRAYVKLALQDKYLEMRELAEGGNQPNLNLSKVKEFKVPLPSLAEQAEVVRRVDILCAVADRLESRLSQAQTAVDRLTPALLAKAFRGELVPQDPADEAAGALLQRLAAQPVEAPIRRGRPRRAVLA